MKQIIVWLMMCGLMINTACVSNYAHKNWKEAQQQQAVIIAADGEQVRVGVDLSATSYLKDNWPIAIGAALVDGALIYGTYKAADRVIGGGGGDNQTEQSLSDTGNAGRDNTSISINGNGNSVNISDNNNTTTSGF